MSDQQGSPSRLMQDQILKDCENRPSMCFGGGNAVIMVAFRKMAD